MTAPSDENPAARTWSELAGQRLVIFGCGYLGQAVAVAAAAAGARVEALTRNSEKAEGLRAAGFAHVVVADLASSDWHGQIAGAPDFVVNCVSAGGGADGYRRSYVDGLRSILDWAGRGRTPVGTMVYTSSTSVYPQGAGARVDETAPAEGATPNGQIIRESELLLEQAAPGARRRWFILRLAGIYGPDRHHLLDQLRSGATRLGGAGDHRLNLVHRDDAMTAILASLVSPPTVAGGIFNVSDDAPARREDVVRWLAARLGRAMPEFDGSTTARRGGAPMPDRIIDNRKMRTVLGWRPQWADYRAGFGEILGNSGQGRGGTKEY